MQITWSSSSWRVVHIVKDRAARGPALNYRWFTGFNPNFTRPPLTWSPSHIEKGEKTQRMSGVRARDACMVIRDLPIGRSLITMHALFSDGSHCSSPRARDTRRLVPQSLIHCCFNIVPACKPMGQYIATTFWHSGVFAVSNHSQGIPWDKHFLFDVSTTSSLCSYYFKSQKTRETNSIPV